MNGRQRRKCDVYSQKLHVSAKPINCLPFYMLKISAELKKSLINWLIAWIFGQLKGKIFYPELWYSISSISAPSFTIPIVGGLESISIPSVLSLLHRLAVLHAVIVMKYLYPSCRIKPSKTMSGKNIVRYFFY